MYTPTPPPSPSTRKTRADAYADNRHFADTGCQYHPSCLTCPEPTCLLELPPSQRRPRYRGRRAAIRALYLMGTSTPDICSILRIPRRTAFRHVAALREQNLRLKTTSPYPQHSPNKRRPPPAA